MKIKEIEKKVGMTRANIRYYEKEGLFHPAREKENNYREYSMEDARALQRIKTLRVLGVSVAEIREMEEGSAFLDEVIKKRLEAIEDEKKNLEAVKAACKNILARQLSFDLIEESAPLAETKKEKYFWKERMDEILHEDITVEILTQKQLNTNIGVMLIYGFFLNIIVCLLVGDVMLDYRGAASVLSDGILLHCNCDSSGAAGITLSSQRAGS